MIVWIVLLTHISEVLSSLLAVELAMSLGTKINKPGEMNLLACFPHQVNVEGLGHPSRLVVEVPDQAVDPFIKAV